MELEAVLQQAVGGQHGGLEQQQQQQLEKRDLKYLVS
jgi:hypothetical protein